MPRMREAMRSGWNMSKSSSFSPVLANMIWRPVTDATDKRRATARIAVELGEHDAVETDAVEERLSGVDGVLADHRVDDEQDLVRVDGVADVDRLLHHLGVDAEPAGGVDDARCRDPCRLACSIAARDDRDRIADTAAGFGREHRHAGPLAEHLQLLHGVRPLQVGGDQQRRVALARTATWPSLPASVVLPEPCRPASMMTVGGFFA